jgi:hypothetical protein
VAAQLGVADHRGGPPPRRLPPTPG